jgi:hypothetical protein
MRAVAFDAFLGRNDSESRVASLTRLARTEVVAALHAFLAEAEKQTVALRAAGRV